MTHHTRSATTKLRRQRWARLRVPLLQAIHRKGLTYQEIADAIDRSMRSISRSMGSDDNPPADATIDTLLQFLEVTDEYHG